MRQWTPASKGSSPSSHQYRIHQTQYDKYQGNRMKQITSTKLPETPCDLYPNIKHGLGVTSPNRTIYISSYFYRGNQDQHMWHHLPFYQPPWPLWPDYPSKTACWQIWSDLSPVFFPTIPTRHVCHMCGFILHSNHPGKISREVFQQKLSNSVFTYNV